MILPVTTAKSLDNSELEALTSFACELADAAAAVILPYFKTPVPVDHKPGRGSFDPVTIADRSAEAAMRKLISERFPQHGVLGEEYGFVEGESGLTWVLDPIDGTRAFIAGIPLWGTLIALYDGEQSVLGVADQPYLQERYVGSRLKAELQSRSGALTLTTRECHSLSEATLMSTSPDIFTTTAQQSAFYSVAEATRMTRYGADCYAYCMLASGFVDVVVEAGLQPYDIQALVPIIERAGGRVTNWRGDRNLDSGQVVAAGCESVLEEALALLNQAASN